MNYARGVIWAFIFFIVFIGTLAYLSFQQNIDLVSDTYYKDELVYTEKMTRISNAHALESPPVFLFNQGALTVRFDLWHRVTTATVTVMRPSDASFDKVFEATGVSDSVMVFPLETWKKGLYRVSMRWTMDGKEYQYEKGLSL